MSHIPADASLIPEAPASPKAGSISALARLNFFLADVRDGLGPFLGIYLVGLGWQADAIGTVMTLGGLAGMLATTPLGMLADATRAKRAMVAVPAVLVVAASIVLLLNPTLVTVAVSQVATGIAGAAIGPAIAGLTLGLVGQAGLTRQLGRNEAWNHGGNFAAAGLAGLFGYFYGITAVFVLMSLMAVGSLLMLVRIRPRDIDHDAARGLDAAEAGEGHPVPGFTTLLRNGPLLVLAVTLGLFHLGNAAMLPLLSQAVATSGAFDPAAYAAGTVLVAQATMIPMALLAARLAETRGYGLVMVLALVALPVRGLIAGFWPDPLAMLPVQVLDGVGAGLLGVATPGLVARILKGTGHVNAGLGAVMTVQGIGAALSPAFAGLVAARFGYAPAFLCLGGVAVAGLALWLACRPVVRAACEGRAVSG
ncbi:MFS transporter [Azorhizobium oxalatiphilum]|uniref:MFS transporter n=1 Tax=Azorhizobium oxalatiphilum TaxID=980631 RepID=A0A917C9V4_9HYPH|nr:MFS transporter [Azorhizobium oxalatiphilum]GGF79034.1 MFS transporter [Azorhizobium oxalatiphilum]